MKQRTLVFWSPRSKPYLTEELVNADHLVELPDKLTPQMMERMPDKLTTLFFEQISLAKQNGQELRVVQTGPGAIDEAINIVLAKLVGANGGQVTVIQHSKKKDDEPSVVIDAETSFNVVDSIGKVDFSKPPAKDARLYSDSYPATLERPA